MRFAGIPAYDVQMAKNNTTRSTTATDLFVTFNYNGTLKANIRS